MPMRPAVRMMRQAISPRLAIKRVRNMRRAVVRCAWSALFLLCSGGAANSIFCASASSAGNEQWRAGPRPQQRSNARTGCRQEGFGVSFVAHGLLCEQPVGDQTDLPFGDLKSEKRQRYDRTTTGHADKRRQAWLDQLGETAHPDRTNGPEEEDAITLALLFEVLEERKNGLHGQIAADQLCQRDRWVGHALAQDVLLAFVVHVECGAADIGAGRNPFDRNALETLLKQNLDERAHQRLLTSFCPAIGLRGLHQLHFRLNCTARRWAFHASVPTGIRTNPH